MVGDKWLISDEPWAKMQLLLPEHKANRTLGGIANWLPTESTAFRCAGMRASPVSAFNG